VTSNAAPWPRRAPSTRAWSVVRSLLRPISTTQS
jgi:hypothetical protein